jgi:probable rRNA maturation factor
MPTVPDSRIVADSEPEPAGVRLPAGGSAQPGRTAHTALPRLHILLDAGDVPAPDGLNDAFVGQCCRTALLAQRLLEPGSVCTVELSVQLLAQDAMRQLNHQYRLLNSPTNVLSFAAGMPPMTPESEAGGDQPEGSLLVLGDLVLCPEVIAREANEQGKPLMHHWAHMLVHGTLHLCGYDHEQPAESQAMESAEIRILSTLGIPDPYLVTSAVIDS